MGSLFRLEVARMSTTERWIHPLCRPIALEHKGPFANLPDGRVLTINKDGALVSADDGATWTALAPAALGQDPTEPASSQLVCTASGAVVMVFLEMTDYTFTWDEDAGEPGPGCKLDLWAARSLDGGQTWVDRQRLLDGYNANFFGLIQTRAGRLVAVVEHLAEKPGRWVVCSFYSDDDGQTWGRSNIIDLGGHGHHDGCTEPTVAELSDGRVLMLIRTNWDRFWEAISEDGGRYWRKINPGRLDASSAPGHLQRLKSGRLALLWNRLNPTGGVAPKADPGQAAETPASWYREELSIAFSEDDGETWTPPLVIARQPGGQLSYPCLFERKPGVLWLVAGFAFNKGWEDQEPLRLVASEEELVRASAH